MNSTFGFVRNVFFIFILLLFITSPVIPNELVIFPSRQQSDEQMEKDKYACYQWARQQSGFDPMAPPKTAAASQPAQQAPKGGVVKGAARGALVGVTVGAITNNSKGRSAAAGAAAGGLVGGMGRRDHAQQQTQADQQRKDQEEAEYDQQRTGYNRAYSACLEGKGYTVK